MKYWCNKTSEKKRETNEFNEIYFDSIEWDLDLNQIESASYTISSKIEKSAFNFVLFRIRMWSKETEKTLD